MCAARQQLRSVVVLQGSGLCNAQLMLPPAAADYDDSYAVNSASQGPWGDAIMHELLPEIESRFRKPIQRCRVTASAALSKRVRAMVVRVWSGGIGEGWARFTYGGSTGGWEALAVQVLYPVRRPLCML